jgi:hypothetical protein
MPDSLNNKNEQEFKTFGFAGKLRTGFVTGTFGLMFSAIVFLYQEGRRKDAVLQGCNDSKLAIQEELYERMLPEVKQKVKEEVSEQVKPMVDRADTTMTNIDNLIESIQK